MATSEPQHNIPTHEGNHRDLDYAVATLNEHIWGEDIFAQLFDDQTHVTSSQVQLTNQHNIDYNLQTSALESVPTSANGVFEEPEAVEGGDGSAAAAGLDDSAIRVWETQEEYIDRLKLAKQTMNLEHRQIELPSGFSLPLSSLPLAVQVAERHRVADAWEIHDAKVNRNSNKYDNAYHLKFDKEYEAMKIRNNDRRREALVKKRNDDELLGNPRVCSPPPPHEPSYKLWDWGYDGPLPVDYIPRQEMKKLQQAILAKKKEVDRSPKPQRPGRFRIRAPRRRQPARGRRSNANVISGTNLNNSQPQRIYGTREDEDSSDEESEDDDEYQPPNKRPRNEKHGQQQCHHKCNMCVEIPGDCSYQIDGRLPCERCEIIGVGQKCQASLGGIQSGPAQRQVARPPWHSDLFSNGREQPISSASSDYSQHQPSREQHMVPALQQQQQLEPQQQQARGMKRKRTEPPPTDPALEENRNGKRAPPLTRKCVSCTTRKGGTTVARCDLRQTAPEPCTRCRDRGEVCVEDLEYRERNKRKNGAGGPDLDPELARRALEDSNRQAKVRRGRKPWNSDAQAQPDAQRERIMHDPSVQRPKIGLGIQFPADMPDDFADCFPDPLDRPVATLEHQLKAPPNPFPESMLNFQALTPKYQNLHQSVKPPLYQAAFNSGGHRRTRYRSNVVMKLVVSDIDDFFSPFASSVQAVQPAPIVTATRPLVGRRNDERQQSIRSTTSQKTALNNAMENVNILEDDTEAENNLWNALGGKLGLFQQHQQVLGSQRDQSNQHWQPSDSDKLGQNSPNRSLDSYKDAADDVDPLEAIPDPDLDQQAIMNRIVDWENTGGKPKCQETIGDEELAITCERVPAHNCKAKDHGHFNTCTTCHLAQDDMVLPETGASIYELLSRGRVYHCKDCTDRFRDVRDVDAIDPAVNARPVMFGMCSCENKLRNTWLCNQHKTNAIGTLKRRILEGLMKEANRTVCPNCEKLPREVGVDESWECMVWECLSCHNIVVSRDL